MFLERKCHVHTVHACYHGKWQHGAGEDGEHRHYFVGAVGLQRVERLREAFDKFAVILHGVEHLLVLVEDIAPVVFHLLASGEALDAAAFELVEESDLRFEGGVEQDDVASGDGYLFDDGPCFLAENVVVDEVHFGADACDEGVGLGHEPVEDAVEQYVAGFEGGDGLFVVVGEAFADGLEGLFHGPVRLADGDDIVLSPEDFHLFDADEFVAFVEIGEMEDKEIVVVVLVDFWALVSAAAVFDVERVEVVGFKQVAVVFFAGV